MIKFADLKLDPNVLKAIAEAGYETPTPIQAGAIPPALEGRDVLGIAQTGTGKTASFTLPMITLLGRGRARARMPRSLVLCPTRELAAQVAENFDIYAKNTRLTKALLIGGVSFNEQDKLIDRGVDVLIATPGRLLDHFERGKLLLTGVQIMVVDEADRMLDMGFIPDIERIFQLTPSLTRQTLFFSATMAPEIERITDTFLHAPERIEVARQATTSETITQRLVEITPTRRDQSAKQKRELLRALIDAEGPADAEGGLKNAIIFCNRKTDVDIVAKSLKAHGYDAAPIHGDLDQRQRMATLDGFRDGTLRFLVASDVAARGLDIPAVSHVFNFDLPSHAEDYVHRIGRTGRAGRLGTAISIGTPADEKYLAAIESLVKATLPRGALPEGFSLSEAAQSAPRPPREGRERSGSRSRRGGRDSSRERPARDAQADDGRTADRHAAAEPPRSSEREERRDDRRSERREERRDDQREGRREERRDEQREPRRDDRREERRDGRRGDRRDDRRDRGPAVTGMGDHVPDFMLTSFRPSGFADADDAVVAAPAPEVQPPVAPAVGAPSPVSAPKAEPVAPEARILPADPAPAAAVAAQDAASVGPADPGAETAEPAKPARKRSSRAKKAAAGLDAATAPAESAPAQAGSDAPAAPASEPKPKRTRSRKKPEAEAVPAQGDDPATTETPAKPKRTRSRKKPVDADAATATVASEPAPATAANDATAE